MMPHQDLRSFYAAVMRGYRRWAWPLLAIAVALAVASVYYTVTNLSIRTSRNDLVASNQSLIQQTEKMDRAFGGRDGLVVVVENGNPSGPSSLPMSWPPSCAAIRTTSPNFSITLTRRDSNARPCSIWNARILSNSKTISWDSKTCWRGWRPTPSLTTFYRLVNEQIAQAMIGQLFTGFLAEKDKPELPDVSLLNATLKAAAPPAWKGASPTYPLLPAFFPKELSDLSEEGYFFTEDDKFLLFLVTPKAGRLRLPQPGPGSAAASGGPGESPVSRPQGGGDRPRRPGSRRNEQFPERHHPGHLAVPGGPDGAADPVSPRA